MSLHIETEQGHPAHDVHEGHVELVVEGVGTHVVHARRDPLDDESPAHSIEDAEVNHNPCFLVAFLHLTVSNTDNEQEKNAKNTIADVAEDVVESGDHSERFGAPEVEIAEAVQPQRVVVLVRQHGVEYRCEIKDCSCQHGEPKVSVVFIHLAVIDINRLQGFVFSTL